MGLSPTTAMHASLCAVYDAWLWRCGVLLWGVVVGCWGLSRSF